MLDDTKTEETVEEANVSDENVTGDGNPANLSINDLANIKQIIDVAAARGAFKTNEFQVVGTTCDRLGAFLQSVMPAQEETPATETDETDETTDETTDEATEA